jgi:uncharacterized protein YcbK (DUF882 family)
MRLKRRAFIKLGIASTAACLVPGGALAAIDNLIAPSRRLSFYNLHTNERLNVCYYRQGAYCPDALSKINIILRDHRTGEIQPIDLRLLDLLYAISREIDRQSPFYVISGYRSPKSNTRLRRKSKGVASRSLHMQGKAIDVRLPDYDTAKLKNAVAAMKVGGVGYYPKPNFVHIDTGRVRFWRQ